MPYVNKFFNGLIINCTFHTIIIGIPICGKIIHIRSIVSKFELSIKCWAFSHVGIGKLHLTIICFRGGLEHIFERSTIGHWIFNEHYKPRPIWNEFTCYIRHDFLIIYLTCHVDYLFLNLLYFWIYTVLHKFLITDLFFNFRWIRLWFDWCETDDGYSQQN